MPNVIWSQDSFTQGEISPLMYAKGSVGNYNDALKTAQNVLCKPQGAATKRFGTLYQSTLSGFSNANEMILATFQYANESVYQLIFYQNAIEIYLEGILIATVTTTFTTYEIQNMDFTTLGVQFVMAFIGGRRPQTLTRTPDTGNAIISVSGKLMTLTAAITPGLIVPVQLSIPGTIVSAPQVINGVTYFAYQVDINQIELYQTSEDAKARINAFVFTSMTGVINKVYTFNTWTLANYFFLIFPVFDFIQNYNNNGFTPDHTYNASNKVVADQDVFTPAMVGGIFVGNGGIGRIIFYQDPRTIFIANITLCQIIVE